METNRKALVALIFLTSCGYCEPGRRGRQGPSGASCTISKVDGTTTITCPDGTSQTVVDGERGIQGTAGVGSPGAKGDRGDVGTSTTGDTGATGSGGPMGSQGVAGPMGPSGRDGIDGQSVVGPAGSPGSVITPVTPCPADTSGYPEVLLCIDDNLYAVYDDAPNDVHYAKIPPGTYVTTDHRSCNFTVTTGCILQ